MSKILETQANLRDFLQKPYQRQSWINVFSEFFSNIEIGINQPKLNVGWDSDFQSCTWIGKINLKDANNRFKPVWVIELKLKKNNRIKAKIALRKGLSKLLEAGSVETVLAFFLGEDESFDYRVTFASAEWDFVEGKLCKTETPSKRYSFVFGPSEPCTTGSQRLYTLSQQRSSANFADLVNAFSVEKLNKDFFSGYIEQHKQLLWAVCKKNGSNFFNIKQPEDLKELIRDNQYKPIRNFVKRFMGRIVFLYFVQKKGWLGANPKQPKGVFKDGNLSFIKDISTTSENNVDGYSQFIKLFFDVLNTDRAYNNDICSLTNTKVPYLNSGLFEPEKIVHTKRMGNLEQHLKISIPKENVKSYLNFLDQYNFTIDENSPNEGDVGIDPEMLGHIFENLLEDNKDRGTYYTPKIIVEFMCKEAILSFLIQKLNLVGDERNELTKFVNGISSIRKPLTDDLTKLVYGSLRKVRICDPAVGSGAFPIGILHEILWILIDLGDSRDHGLIKREIIAHSLRGVDLDGNAVEIARLRFWLSLIVDSSIPEPLPNLDFTLIQGNSLVGIDGETEKLIASKKSRSNTPNKLDQYSLSFNSDEPSEDGVSSILTEFYDAHGYKKLNLLRKIIDKEKDYLTAIRDEAKRLICSYRKSTNTSYSNDKRIKNIEKNISSLEIDSGERGYFLWNWYFGDILDEGGFDIFISNPPYVGEKSHKEIFEPIKDTSLGVRFYQGKMDLFYFFIHLSLDLLKEKGVATFITTNYFITATGASKLRLDLKDRSTFLKSFNFNEYKIFESALGQHNAISIFQKGKYETDAQTCITNAKGYLTSERFNSIILGNDLETSYFSISQDHIFSKGNLSLTSEPADLISIKLSKECLNLSTICNINQGLITGADKVSESIRRKYNEINYDKGYGIYVIEKNAAVNFANDKESKKSLKPWFKNSDISRYSVNETTDQWVLYMDRKHDKCNPLILKHLKPFKRLLESRRDENDYHWWQLHRPRNEEIFISEKIVAPQRSKRNTFGYTNKPWYASADVYFITAKSGISKTYNLKHILGILNSQLIFHWLNKFGKKKGDSLELYQEPLSDIPIPFFKNENNLLDKLENIVDKLIQDPSKNSTLEKDLNAIVFKLYNFSDSEAESYVNGGGGNHTLMSSERVKPV